MHSTTSCCVRCGLALLALLNATEAAPPDGGLHATRSKELINATAAPACYKGNYKGSMGTGGEDAVVIKALGSPSATAAQYVASGYLWIQCGRPALRFLRLSERDTTAVPCDRCIRAPLVG